MPDTEKTKDSPVSPVKSTGDDGPPESPTTARPLDFDSDQETGTANTEAKQQSETAPKPPPKDETPPAKPPRPVSAREQAENTLKEAFPTIDATVVRAVLSASGGQVEPAFNALLEMSDPDAAKRNQEAPAMPPRPVRQEGIQPQPQTQSHIDSDEQYARQLQEHYSNTEARRPSGGARPRYNENLQGSRSGRPGGQPNPDDVHWRSFFDDDLPEIRDNIKKGFLETQSTVNSWLTSFKKKLDGEDDDENDFTSQPPRPAQTYGSGQPYGRRSMDQARRSAEMSRYDADPQVIGDDFSKLELRDGEAPPRTSSRPLANPNLFKSDSHRPSSGRKVSFQEGPPEEIRDMYSASPKPAANADGTTTTTANTTGMGTTGKTSKWQPLSTVDPSPVENDPFSLGDSDDDAAAATTKKDESSAAKKDETVTTAAKKEETSVKK